MSRLPATRKASDNGIIYVTQEGPAYKIGFSRKRLRRRVRESGGQLVLTIQTGQRPAQLEYLIANRFADKRLVGYKTNHGGKREWFALDEADLDWLRGLAVHLFKAQYVVVRPQTGQAQSMVENSPES